MSSVARGAAAVRCPHGPRCVPCPLRGLPYREQLARKRRTVEDALRSYPGLGAVDVGDVVGSRDLFGYRNVAKLAVRPARGGGLRAGVYEPGTHRLVEASRCEVQHPAISEAIEATLEEASRLGLSAYDERAGTGDLRYVVARWSAWSRRVLLILVTARRDLPALRELARGLPRRVRSLGGIVQNVNGERGNVILGRTWATLRPPAVLVDRIGFLTLQTSPGSFLQGNLWSARRIYETALEWAGLRGGDVAIDVFCGVGPLSFYLATRSARVFGIEEVEGAVADARANQRRNGFHNLRFEAAPAEEALPRLRSELGRASLVTLNPPRKGVTHAVLAEVAALSPERIVYVSCNPETLARDLDRLGGLGYRTLRTLPFDMLPQTEHVEVVALAERA